MSLIYDLESLYRSRTVKNIPYSALGNAEMFEEFSIARGAYAKMVFKDSTKVVMHCRMLKGARLYTHVHDCEEHLFLTNGYLVNTISKTRIVVNEKEIIPAHQKHQHKALEDSSFLVVFINPNTNLKSQS